MQQHVGAARKEARGFAVPHPNLVPHREAIETLLDGGPFEPILNCCRAKLKKHPLAAILHSRIPSGIERNLSALDVGLVFPINIGCHSFQARETNER